MNFIQRLRLAFSRNIHYSVNPQFGELDSFIATLPQTFDSQREVIHCGRNQIKVYQMGDMRINVKRFGIPPYFFNRIIYVLFRDTKAQRSYDYALRLASLGLDSPSPVGYYLRKRGLLLCNCYLATLQEDDVYQLMDRKRVSDLVSEEQVLEEFGRYTALLHQRGVYHFDYSMGNVLFRVLDGKPRFTMVDINRMRFGAVSFEMGCKNFHRLGFSEREFRIVSDSYSSAMGYDPELTYQHIMASHQKKSSLLCFKRKAKAAVRCTLHLS